jgi:hypothetical protein
MSDFPKMEYELIVPPPLRLNGNTALGLLQTVYRDQDLPLPVRMRAAAIALPFEAPKLTAIANVSPQEFSIALEKAINRSGVRLIAADVINGATDK